MTTFDIVLPLEGLNSFLAVLQEPSVTQFGIYSIEERVWKFQAGITGFRGDAWSVAPQSGVAAAICWQTGETKVLSIRDGTQIASLRTPNAEIIKVSDTIRVTGRGKMREFTLSGEYRDERCVPTDTIFDTGAELLCHRNGRYVIAGEIEEIGIWKGQGTGPTECCSSGKLLAVADSRGDCFIWDTALKKIVLSVASAENCNPIHCGIDKVTSSFCVFYASLSGGESFLRAFDVKSSEMLYEAVCSLSPPVAAFITPARCFVTGGGKIVSPNGEVVQI